MGVCLFQCHLCNKNLSSKQNLKEHLQVHSNAKPFTCKSCGSRFNKGSDLVKHKATHGNTQRDGDLEIPKLGDLIKSDTELDPEKETVKLEDPLDDSELVALPQIRHVMNPDAEYDVPLPDITEG
jgi:uncharacterized Zn-finger protein